MPEDNQIQHGFQPENQVNSQIQQNNFIQEQQVQGTFQQVSQQNAMESTTQNIQKLTENQVQTIYYHPSRLTKILSGIYRFIGIALVWSGLWNFSLIGTDGLSFLKILCVGGIITLCGIGYFLFGRLLYNTKIKIHLGISLLLALILSIIFSRILRAFSDNNGFLIDSDTLESFRIILVLFTLIYFSVSTIKWFIKYRRFKKKGLISSKYLNSIPSKKKVGIIVTIILLLIVIVNLIYGKMQWSKIPEVDESMFNRTEHQNKLPDEEDALVQLRAFYDGNKGKVIDILDAYYFYDFSTSNSNPKNADISWRQHTNECIVINSGGNKYCGTRSWNKNTLNRVLNNYYYMDYTDYTKDFINSDGYFSIDGEKVTIFEYIQKNESEIRAIFQELDRIASLDYYLPNDEILNLIPPYFQGFSRASMVVLQYYIYQEDWDMVMFIVKLNYKIINILNNSGSFVNQLISIALQGIVDSSINLYIQIFPENFRKELSQRYPTQVNDKNEIIDKTIKGEYVIWNWAKNGNIMGEVGKDTPSLLQFLFHFPFYSEEEINRLMVYGYYDLFKGNGDNIDLIIDKTIKTPSLYNVFGYYPVQALMPRMPSINDRINRSIYHKESLIKNLKSGKYDVWFNKLDWESNPYEYENYRLPTDEQLFENKIERYSDITNKCFGKDKIRYSYKKWCHETLAELNNQEYDDFGLKEILIEIAQLWVDYDENEVEIENCTTREGSVCKKLFNKEQELLKKLEKNYIRLVDILENIKNKAPEVEIDDYFYIPGNEYFYIPEMVYDEGDELNLSKTDDIESDDIELQSIGKINENNKEVSSGNKSDEQLTYEKLVNLTNGCMGEDILRSRVDLSYDDFINQCNYVMGELKKRDNDGDFKQLNRILTYIAKEWVEHANIGKNEDLLFEKEGTDVGGGTPEWDVLFNREDKNLENFKKYYPKLEEIKEKIIQEYEFTPEVDFYIPYSVINENTFRFTLHL